MLLVRARITFCSEEKLTAVNWWMLMWLSLIKDWNRAQLFGIFITSPFLLSICKLHKQSNVNQQNQIIKEYQPHYTSPCVSLTSLTEQHLSSWLPFNLKAFLPNTALRKAEQFGDLLMPLLQPLSKGSCCSCRKCPSSFDMDILMCNVNWRWREKVFGAEDVVIMKKDKCNCVIEQGGISTEIWKAEQRNRATRLMTRDINLRDGPLL